MIAPGPEIWLRAVGTALAGVSIAFAGYMLAYGGGKVRVNGIDHLAIFAQPRGPGGGGVTEIAREAHRLSMQKHLPQPPNPAAGSGTRSAS